MRQQSYLDISGHSSLMFNTQWTKRIPSLYDKLFSELSIFIKFSDEIYIVCGDYYEKKQTFTNADMCI